MSLVKRGASFFLLALLVFCLDFFSKSYVHSSIPLIGQGAPDFPYGGIGVFQQWMGIDFSINHVINRGAAWGILSSLQEPLLYFRILVIGGLLTHLLFFNRIQARVIPFILILAGAIGNVVDFFVYGHVIDMFYFVFWGYSYPLFNIADSAIFSGIALLLFQAIVSKEKLSHRKAL
jgi:signal peptidase II